MSLLVALTVFTVVSLSGAALGMMVGFRQDEMDGGSP